ncbi:uncharacterized protein LOC113274479 [Papaver somniferum]|uniref:uncharacterized protein LOC113274479 n=1 Tax=Papaver somniferum TaxID=3469 RepID=UPI000E6F8FEC|nr:uncharacterized protein LOC113274479 [Papaver somniferum]
MLRDQYAREQEEERNNIVRERARLERERCRRKRKETEEREIEEAIRQNNHENRLRQAILKRHMQQDLDQTMSEEILREMTELREMMTARKNSGRRQLEEAVEEAGKTPFARKIQIAIIPPKCNLHVFTSIFDGSTCAVQHIKAYSRSLLEYEENDAMLCKYFPASLTGEALQWFEGLLVGTIRSFRHLQNIFVGQYISNNMSRPGIETAFGLRRRFNESLCHLTTRWRTMCSEMIRRVDERFLILAFVNALFPTDLLYTQIFRIKDTITMSELREFQEEYTALEEKQRDMESYPVAMPNANIVNASLLPRMTNVVVSTSQGNQGKNNTEMEQKLVAMGSADQEEFEREYKEAQSQARGRNNKIQRMDNPMEGYGEDFHDNILSRVYERDNDGREILNFAKISPLKDWQKQAISFSAEETPGGGELHEYPLVVKLGINPKAKIDDEDEEEDESNTWAINRILIDPGSSVDILFYHTYKTMGGRDNDLIPST